MINFLPSKMKIIKESPEFILEWLYKMTSEEFLKLWEKCDTSEKIKKDVPEAPDEEFIKCLNGTVGEKWIQNNTDAKCISENLPFSTCKTTVQQESGSILKDRWLINWVNKF